MVLFGVMFEFGNSRTYPSIHNRLEIDPGGFQSLMMDSWISETVGGKCFLRC